MKDELINILETFKYPVRLQGSIAPEQQYPESFFTFWNNDTNDGNHYDNEPVSCIWDFTVYFYSVDPTLVNTVMEEAVKRLKAAGWIISGKGYDAPSDETSHTGRAVDIVYIEREN